MASTIPTRIDDDLFAAAKAVGAVVSRSAAQQINHWARIGRQLEASAHISQPDITRVLSGEISYDAVNAHAQAAVRAEWEERMTALREGLDFTAELNATGGTWAEADPKGRPVLHPPAKAAKRPAKAPTKRARPAT